MSPPSSTRTRRVACGSKEIVRGGDAAIAPPRSCAPPSGMSCARPTPKRPRSGNCIKFLLTRSERVRHASIIQRAKTIPALRVKTASDQECTVPKASVVVTTARHSMRMMKRLQTVCGGSAAAARVGGALGGGGSAAARSARGRASAGAFEVDMVIPDFSVDGAGLLRAGDAHEADDDGLGLRTRGELDRRLLPVVRLGRHRPGLPERGRLRGRVGDERVECRDGPPAVGADGGGP